MPNTTNTQGSDTLRWMMIVGLVLVAFFGAYKFASARSGQSASASAITASTAAAGGASGVASRGAADSGAGCACCGGSEPTQDGVTGTPVQGVASVEGGVQKISVDVTTVYNPNIIKLKAGVPAEVTFSQAQGCTQVVESTDLKFSEDLSGGPKTVKLDGLQPGTYSFSCGMQMVFGQIVVE